MGRSVVDKRVKSEMSQTFPLTAKGAALPHSLNDIGSPTQRPATKMKPAGIPCRVVERHRLEDWVDVPTAHGQLMEVRRYCSGRRKRCVDDSQRMLTYGHGEGQASGERDVPALADDCDDEEGSLFGYVRFKDTNNRRSAWVPAENILTAPGAGGLSAPPLNASSSLAPFSARPCRTARSGVYNTPTEEMLRARSGACGDHASPLLEFFDARLRRDIQCPSPIRYIHYLQRLTFAPWYYAPVHTLFPSFAWEQTDVLYDAHLCPFTLEHFTSVAALEEHHSRLARFHRHSRRQAGPPLLPAPTTRTSTTAATNEVEAPPATSSDEATLPTLMPVDNPDPGRQVWKLPLRPLHPPGGHEIYRNDEAGVSLFEIRGKHHPEYVRNVFLIGKAFLENKLVGHDVDVYVFVVVCLHAAKHAPWVLHAMGLTSPEDIAAVDGMVFAGFFSWEDGVSHDNLACIAVLPCFGGMGLGNFLIAASYELAYRRGDIGSPERPLSDLGQAAYRVFWRDVIFCWLAMRLAHAIEETYDIHPHWRPASAISEPHYEQVPKAERGEAATGGYQTRLRSKSTNREGPSPRTTGAQQRSTLWPYARRSMQSSDVAKVIAFLRESREIILAQRQGNGAAGGIVVDDVGTTAGSSLRRPQRLHNGKGGERAKDVGGNRRPQSKKASLEPVVIHDDRTEAVLVSSDTSEEEESDADEMSSVSSIAQEASGKAGGVSTTERCRPRHSRRSSADIEVLFNCRVSHIASEVMLEEADVLDCLLWSGLIHRVTVDDTTVICAPLLYIAAVLEDRVLVPAADDSTPQSSSRIVVRFDPSRLVDRKRRQR